MQEQSFYILYFYFGLRSFFFGLVPRSAVYSCIHAFFLIFIL
jgi:hypothetical protein